MAAGATKVTSWAILAHVSKILGVGVLSGVFTTVCLAIIFQGDFTRRVNGTEIGIDIKSLTLRTSVPCYVFASLTICAYTANISAFPQGGIKRRCGHYVH